MPTVPRLAALAAVFVIAVAIRTADADPITLMWDSNPSEEAVLGYVVYVSQASSLIAEYDVGNQTSFVYPDAVAGQEYSFAVAAYNVLGVGPSAALSGFSNAPPDLVDPGDPVYAVGEAVALQLVGSDRYGETVSYNATGLPPGLTLTASTGLISGAGTTAGIYNVTATVFDGLFFSTPRSFTWFIDGTPPTVTVILPTTQPTYSTNVATIALAGTAGDDIGVASVTWVNSKGGTGTATLTTSTTWQIPAVPLLAGDNVITVTVRDVANYTTADVITVTASGVPFVQIGLPTSEASYVTSNSTVPLAGMAIDSAGVTSVTWTTDRGGSGTAQLNTSQGLTSWNVAAVPLQKGTNVITATAWNALGNSSNAVLTVQRLNNAPTLNNPGDRSNAEGDVVSLQLVGGDVDADSITYTQAGLPPGLTLNPSSGLISGTLPYTAAGVYPTTLAASDGPGTTSVFPIWTVTNTNRAPVVTNPGPQGAFQGVGIVLAMSAVDEDNDPLTWSAQNLPPGIAINPFTGMLSGTPTTLGTFATAISAWDNSATAQAAFAWTVASPLPGPASPASPSGITGTATPAFSWPGVPLVSYYALSISDAGAGSPMLVWYTPAQAGCPGGAGTCTVAAPRALAGGLVSWKVLTWNPYGYGPWSTTMSAVVDLADASVPIPTAVGPSGPIGTRTPTYWWQTIGDATWYQVSVTDALGTVREFWYSSAVACDTTPCGETPNALLAIGPAQWRVRAWRASGAGAWTAPANFEAVDAAPGKATLVSPTAPVSSATPAFTWNAVLGTSYYLLRVYDRDDVIIERWYRPADAGCYLGTGICAASLGTTINPGPANWLVLTWNGSGYGPWSDPRNFSVEVPDPSASTPATISPTGVISTPNATYTWTAVSGVTSYRLSIANNGSAAAYWWYTPAGAGCAAAAECSATPQAGLLNGTAQWQVQAWTTIGHSAWSAPVALTVSIAAPAAPGLVSPSGSTTAAPSFVWNASAGTTLYYIRASDAIGLRVDRWLTPAQVGCSSGTGVCTFNAGVTLNSGAGSWQVIAWNASGYSPWSSTLGFVVP